MTSKNNLYSLLVKMEDAAEHKDRDQVVRINKEFSPMYFNIFREVPYEEGSMKMLFDRARNKFVFAVQEHDPEYIEECEEERKESLKEGRELIKKIKKKLD